VRGNRRLTREIMIMSSTGVTMSWQLQFPETAFRLSIGPWGDSILEIKNSPHCTHGYRQTLQFLGVGSDNAIINQNTYKIGHNTLHVLDNERRKWLRCSYASPSFYPGIIGLRKVFPESPLAVPSVSLNRQPHPPPPPRVHDPDQEGRVA
jgi:hypothetical protein